MPDHHTHQAIAHYRRTGNILPGEAGRIASYLADRSEAED